MKVYIGLGSNLGNGKVTLKGAWQAIGEIDGIRLDRLSSPYSTAPVDMQSGHWFTNSVGCLDVTLSPFEVLDALLEVEAAFGRTRDDSSFGYQDRSLDLDLLYYGKEKMETPELVVPHPRIGERLFVLVPLAELEPDFIDPVSQKSVREMEKTLRHNIGSHSRKEQEIIRSSWED